MFAETKKRVLRKRKKAVKAGIPEQFLALADYHLDRAIFFRQRSKEAKSGQKARSYDRALSSLLRSEEVFDASLNNRFSYYSKRLLQQELK